MYLTLHPELKTRVVAEMQAMLTKYNATPSSMDHIPSVAWCDQSELPSLHLIGNEILRCMGVGMLLRRNMGDEVEIDGCTIPRGGMVVLPMFDIHHNPDFYGAHAQEFDPRHLEHPPNDGTVRFVGFGAGALSLFFNICFESNVGHLT